MMIELTRDGAGTIGDVKRVYEGWQYPSSWVLECHCLEAPKPLYHNGYYYLSSAEGGTGRPVPLLTTWIIQRCEAATEK